MAAGEDAGKPISLFYSYSHRDEELRRQLEDHLAALRWSGMIAEWHDRNIDVGDEWAKEIDQNLGSADIILLLVSASFIASKYCWSVEMTKALERHDKGEARVIPVILRPCRWGATPFAKLQAAPTDAKPVTTWSDTDAALDDVAGKIERVVRELQQQRRSISEQAQQAEEARYRQAAEEQRPAALERQQEKVQKQADAAARRAAEQEQQEVPEAQPQARTVGVADFAVFRDVDAPWCPELVALPAGTFLMGSPESDTESYSDERPQHRVTIRDRFAIGRYPVTFAEYEHFCAVSKREKPSDLGWGRGQRPVINVSWRDAQDYVAWLAKETGKPYRLPTEAEWEYAARAGTTTRYAFGDTITPKQANFADSKLGKTTEVGAYPPNAWGLYDMHGNVWEWVQDVWHDNYTGAPTDGSAWTDGEGKESSRSHVDRGGSWIDSPWYLRSAIRCGILPDLRFVNRGFRVARTLD